jgi:hypothetical protein
MLSEPQQIGFIKGRQLLHMESRILLGRRTRTEWATDMSIDCMEYSKFAACPKNGT